MIFGGAILRTAEIAGRDCVVCLAGAGAHSMLGIDALDVLAFGPRHVPLALCPPHDLTACGVSRLDVLRIRPGV